MFALVVELHVKPEMRERFLAAISANAEASVRDERGCACFDVVQDRDDPLHFYLYELYADEAAFDEHRKTPHFAAWRTAAAACLREDDGQQNVFGQLVFSGGA